MKSFIGRLVTGYVGLVERSRETADEAKALYAGKPIADVRRALGL